MITRLIRRPARHGTFSVFMLPSAVIRDRSFQFWWLPGFLSNFKLFFEKHIPDAVQLIFVAPLSLLITGFASFIVIGPVTMAGANLITDGIVGLFNVVPVLGGALYGLICPPLVITGMHHLFLGVNLQMAGSLGYVTLWPVGEPVTIAQGAACLAYAFIARKNKKQSSVALTSGPFLFHGNHRTCYLRCKLKIQIPFIAVMISGAIGGAWMGFWGVKSTSVGVGGVLSFLSVFPEQWGTVSYRRNPHLRANYRTDYYTFKNKIKYGYCCFKCHKCKRSINIKTQYSKYTAHKKQQRQTISFFSAVFCRIHSTVFSPLILQKNNFRYSILFLHLLFIIFPFLL